MSTLADRLIEARTDKGWKKADLRRAAGIKSASTLTELEAGSITQSPQLPAIAEALGVSSIWLQHGKGDKHHTPALNHPPPLALPPDEAALLASFRALNAKDRARTLLDLEYKAKLTALEDAPPMAAGPPQIVKKA